MDEIVLHDGFVPQGCSAPPQPAVSVGAGAIWLHVYDAVTTKAGRYVQGGGCTTVGVAGAGSKRRVWPAFRKITAPRRHRCWRPRW
jgi:hypothetical protein